MESCPDCKSLSHPKGDCKIGDKGKLKEHNFLVEEIIRLSEYNDWDHQWEALDWDVLHNLKQGSETEHDKIFSTGLRKGLIDDLFDSESSTMGLKPRSAICRMESLVGETNTQGNDPQRQNLVKLVEQNTAVSESSYSVQEKIIEDKHTRDADHLKYVDDYISNEIQVDYKGYEEETIVPKTKATNMNKGLISDAQLRTHIQDNRSSSQTLPDGQALEEMIFKDIQISPIQNLEASFEGVKDSGGDLISLDSEGDIFDNLEGEDDLGLLALGGDQEKRSLAMTLAQNAKVKAGEQKKR
ncbi:hypothetical protein SUGI_0513770 [Cryptomeria japonica]|nr:hypothetical protein SUGI_0513770 [Cryptomeria japonica]